MNDTTNGLTVPRLLAAAMTIAFPVVGAAQVPPAVSSGSPAPAMARAAGMPLHDGALAPGMLTVRIVEGAFTNNLSGQLVRLEVAGGAAQTATTGADGRAQFAHLPIGSRVTASAVVNEEPLLSEEFSMPAESGVRVLLVAGEGPVVAEGSPDPAGMPANHPPIPESAPATVAPGAGGAQADEAGVVAVRVLLVCSTIIAALFFGVRRRRAP
jgi:hypothetical protein